MRAFGGVQNPPGGEGYFGIPARDGVREELALVEVDRESTDLSSTCSKSDRQSSETVIQGLLQPIRQTVIQCQDGWPRL